MLKKTAKDYAKKKGLSYHCDVKVTMKEIVSTYKMSYKRWKGSRREYNEAFKMTPEELIVELNKKYEANNKKNN